MTTCTKYTQKGPGKNLINKLTLLRLVLAGGMALVVTGCTSLAGIGESEYSCASSDGVKCKPTREVYEMTHGGVVPEPEAIEKKKAFYKSGKKIETTNDEVKEVITQKNATTGDNVIDNYVAPRLPDRPVPIRTPAHVMRIWFAPWEDTNGDLNTTGYMYTEVEERRWVIGKGDTSYQSTLRPLQTIPVEKPTN